MEWIINRMGFEKYKFNNLINYYGGMWIFWNEVNC